MGAASADHLVENLAEEINLFGKAQQPRWRCLHALRAARAEYTPAKEIIEKGGLLRWLPI
jgi:hypothetical protein